MIRSITVTRDGFFSAKNTGFNRFIVAYQEIVFFPHFSFVPTNRDEFTWVANFSTTSGIFNKELDNFYSLNKLVFFLWTGVKMLVTFWVQFVKIGFFLRGFFTMHLRFLQTYGWGMLWRRWLHRFFLWWSVTGDGGFYRFVWWYGYIVVYDGFVVGKYL